MPDPVPGVEQDEPSRCPECRNVVTRLYECETCGHVLIPRPPASDEQLTPPRDAG